MCDVKDSWTPEVNTLLNKLRVNSIELSERHRKNWFEYKHYSKYFDIPVIVMSVISSSFSVGAPTYMKQEHVSAVTCGISMIIAMSGSIKLYLNLDDRLKNELEMSKSFYTLSVELFKILSLKREQRNGNGLEFLNKFYSDYIKLFETSSLLRKRLKKDFLMEINKQLLIDDDNSFSGDCETPNVFIRSKSNTLKHMSSIPKFSLFSSSRSQSDLPPSSDVVNIDGALNLETTNISSKKKGKNVKINENIDDVNNNVHNAINDNSSIYVDLYKNNYRNERLNRHNNLQIDTINNGIELKTNMPYNAIEALSCSSTFDNTLDIDDDTHGNNSEAKLDNILNEESNELLNKHNIEKKDNLDDVV
jgi:hypothetical protein